MFRTLDLIGLFIYRVIDLCLKSSSNYVYGYIKRLMFPRLLYETAAFSINLWRKYSI